MMVPCVADHVYTRLESCRFEKTAMVTGSSGDAVGLDGLHAKVVSAAISEVSFTRPPRWSKGYPEVACAWEATARPASKRETAPGILLIVASLHGLD